jgi:hypothetical protein
MKKLYVILGLVAVLVVLVVALVFLGKPKDTIAKNYDVFAKCLAEKGVVMYGAKWCSHCQNQKKQFGDSFKYVKYVECPEQIKLCTEKGIQGFPTWGMPDGQKLIGEQELQTLSMETGCQLP